MKIYLVGDGFLGGHLAKFYAEKEEIRISPPFLPNAISSWIDNIIDDITNFCPDIVLVPAAAQDTGDDRAAIESLIVSNCVLPCRIASLLSDKFPDAMMAVFGTSWQFSDSDTYRPFNLYAASKRAGQDLLTHYALRGLRIIQFILFDTYGEDDTRKKLFNILVAAANANTPIDVTPGDQEIDLVHIDDVCRGVDAGLRELRRWKTRKGLLIRSLGSHRPITVKELVKRLEKKLQKPIHANFGKRDYRPREVMETCRSIPRVLGWDISHNEFSAEQ